MFYQINHKNIMVKRYTHFSLQRYQIRLIHYHKRYQKILLRADKSSKSFKCKKAVSIHVLVITLIVNIYEHYVSLQNHSKLLIFRSKYI
jgi:hypothetical protein